ncbi:MAG: hypothetical protein ACXACH_01095 [Candidatus Hermodarchaeia archaeon]
MPATSAKNGRFCGLYSFIMASVHQFNVEVIKSDGFSILVLPEPYYNLLRARS